MHSRPVRYRADASQSFIDMYRFIALILGKDPNCDLGDAYYYMVRRGMEYSEDYNGN